MAAMDEDRLPSGFARTCWRGIRILHPRDWEPARLCGPKEPTHCVFVDRRYQRLQVDWQTVPGRPDLTEMYKRIGKTGQDKPRPMALKGVPGWRGLVHREGAGCVVHAGTFLADRRFLVQAVLTWPDERDRRLEREVLTGIGPQPAEGGTLWEALGLSVRVPADFELKEGSSKVGRVRWDFARAGHPAEGLTVERLAMPADLLTRPIGQWLGEELPQGFRPLAECAVDCGREGGSQLRSRGGSPLLRTLRRGTGRLDRAWLCRAEDRIYRVAYWRRAAGAVDWPECLQVGCCGGVGLRRACAQQPAGTGSR